MSTLPADAQIDGTSTIGTTTTSPDETMGTYNFPIEKLGVLKNPSKTPLVLVSCGSFSPVTVLHLRMQEMARDWARSNTGFEVVGRYMSPVGDAYGKAGLASAKHRVEMCRLAVADSEIEIDSWEALQKEYQPTARVLDHFEEEINDVYGGVKTSTGEKRKAKIALLAGADLIQTMSTPGVWSEKDLDHILGHYGAFIIERTGTDSDAALEGLQQWKDNIYFIHQLIKNDISSTKIRMALKRDMSVRWLIPDPVIKYIEANHLYQADDTDKEKEKAASSEADKGKQPANQASASGSGTLSFHS